MAIGSKDASESAVFRTYSGGLNTSRDAWVYNFSRRAVEVNMRATVDFYNGQVVAYETFCSASQITDRIEHVREFLNSDPTQISWDHSNMRDLARGTESSFDPVSIRTSTYRPFTREFVYFNRTWNNRVYQLPRMFPTSLHPNYGFYYVGTGSAVPFSVVMIDAVPDRHVTGAGSGGSTFSRWTYEPVDEDGALFEAADGDVVDGYRRVDNITDEALTRFHTAYGSTLTKDDVFFYVYGLLHCPDYRTQFAADLKKMLPRIPKVPAPEDFHAFVDAGRELATLHIGYESVEPYPLTITGAQPTGPGSADLYDWFRVEKMRFGGKSTAKDRSTVVYNPRITVSGIPEEAHEYTLGSRSALEWILERYQTKTDKTSGIVNDPNDWSREVGDPRYILDLLARIVTVSVETVRVVKSLPSIDFSTIAP